MTRWAKIPLIILGVGQWLGCLYLTFGAIVTSSGFIAFLAEIGIIFTVFVDWAVWRARRRD